MGKFKPSEKRYRAYEYAATAFAAYIGKIVPVGSIDLDRDDYRTNKLQAIGEAFNIDKTTEYVRAEACLLLNLGILAQLKVGAPPRLFKKECMAELAVESDPHGREFLIRHWPAIELLAEVLLRKRQLTEPEAIKLIQHHHQTPIQQLHSAVVAEIGNRPPVLQ